ncbi:cytochrome P450 [Rhodocollybia butyracea]|uniref:Cytochrome P450 n=1 Tax=Rhodocollybia butyracea TaxID=206335 RepID=A0A9P5Q1G0_9AGAR|nr:cytochrome P450 [Rhodocollybia butyracea]
MSYLFWKYVQRKRNVVEKLPTPNSASWIWGHELEGFKHEAFEMYLKWAASLGLVYKIKAALFRPDIVIVGDNSAAHHVLQNPDTYARAPLFLQLVARVAGKGIAWAEGEDHKYHRRLLAPAFTSSALEEMTDSIFSCVDKMSRNLRSSLIGTGGVRNSTIVDMVPVRLHILLDGSVSDMNLRTFAGFVVPILMNIFPFIVRLPLPAFQDHVVRKFVHELAGKVLSDNSQDTNVLDSGDILSILRNGNHNMDGKSVAQLSTTELLDNSKALQFNASFSKKFKLCPLDYNNNTALEYLNAVVKEGALNFRLRLYPVGVPAERVALQDDIIPLNQTIHARSGEMISSFAVKAGQVLRIPWAVLNSNEHIWGSKASEFIPERWIEPGGLPPIDKLPHGPWAIYLHFVRGVLLSPLMFFNILR